MSLTIDFDSLKFNLYEIINVTPDSSENKIKKACRNLILHFHPDKNSKVQEDIYNHIFTANQILTNKEYREKYDEYLNKSVSSHFELKNKFEKKNIDTPINEEEAAIKFKTKLDELNKKHQYIDDYNKTNIMQSYEKIKKDRNAQLDIPKEIISNNDDFNNKFDNKKSNEIIITDDPKNISSYNITDNYTAIDIAFNNLYIEDETSNTNKYSSLKTAFKLQPKTSNKIQYTNMEQYKNDTTRYLNTNEFVKDKFESW
jgi:curved DNA-binding protein CbpA